VNIIKYPKLDFYVMMVFFDKYCNSSPLFLVPAKLSLTTPGEVSVNLPGWSLRRQDSC
jgi:hypothetical protein